MAEDIHSDYINWDPKFELGIPTIDKQHKKLVFLCNNLYKEIMNNRSGDTIEWESPMKSALKECADYVQSHFHDEEVLMGAVGYDGLSTHKKEHQDFAKKVLDTVQLFPDVTFNDALKFVRFLYDWILSHIAHYDKLFVKAVLEYYKQHREG